MEDFLELECTCRPRKVKKSCEGNNNQGEKKGPWGSNPFSFFDSL